MKIDNAFSYDGTETLAAKVACCQAEALSGSQQGSEKASPDKDDSSETQCSSPELWTTEMSETFNVEPILGVNGRRFRHFALENGWTMGVMHISYYYHPDLGTRFVPPFAKVGHTPIEDATGHWHSSDASSSPIDHEASLEEDDTSSDSSSNSDGSIGRYKEAPSFSSTPKIASATQSRPQTSVRKQWTVMQPFRPTPSQ